MSTGSRWPDTDRTGLTTPPTFHKATYATPFCRRPIKMSPLCHNRDRPLHALDHGAMVELGMIRKERFTGVPLLLGADTLTEAVATAIPSAGREEKVTWTDRGSHILHR